MAWGWMFGIGMLSYKHYNYISRFLPLFICSLVPLFLMIIYGESDGNRLDLFYFVSYAALILWLAFYLPAAPLKVDLSYGAYIWHMPIINLLLMLGFPNPYLGILLTFMFAVASWFFIEKPALKLKHVALRK